MPAAIEEAASQDFYAAPRFGPVIRRNGPWADRCNRLYKVDRLTRSLADFAKMVEIFDAQDVSFVAVTQQFNTTTSMGRLTTGLR